jgi:Ca2+/H+ antiporter
MPYWHSSVSVLVLLVIDEHSSVLVCASVSANSHVITLTFIGTNHSALLASGGITGTTRTNGRHYSSFSCTKLMVDFSLWKIEEAASWYLIGVIDSYLTSELFVTLLDSLLSLYGYTNKFFTLLPLVSLIRILKGFHSNIPRKCRTTHLRNNA